MAAYAALVSLINIMNQIKNHPRLSTFFDTKQIESLEENVDILLTFIENYTSHGGSIEAEVLEKEIAAAAQVAEDIIESHIVDLLKSGVSGHTEKKLINLQKAKHDLNFTKEKVRKVEEERGFRHKRHKHSKPAVLSRIQTTAKEKMVGFDGHLSQLMDRLTSLQSDRQIIPIVGMGGIGKTTLARNVYESSTVLHYFHVRAWVIISQEYSMRDVILEILSCLDGSISKMDQRSEEELGEHLHKILSGRRYLVVLDDMWVIKSWERLKFYFPENFNGSRIVVTTREQELADEFGNIPLFLNLLDDGNSWDLFCDKAFEQGNCPSELEGVGKSIVKQCKGLPLSIVVIGGFLGRSSMMQEYWENVEEDLSSVLDSVEDNHCLNVLILSYNYLPARLKPCFLYMGIFPEDHKIYVSKLIKLWAAEGFLKPHKDQTAEKVAAGYIKDLVGRNLVLVHSLGLNKKLKIVYIHDLVRDLCLKICEKEKFLCVVGARALDTPPDIDKERRVVIHESIKEEGNSPQGFHLKSTTFARSIIYRSYVHSSFNSRLLRVLSKAHGDSLDAVFQHVNLRHLDYHKDHWITFNLPSSISQFWSLQTLIITGRVNEVVLPYEIWEMPQLRHIKLFWFVSLPNPPPSDGQNVVVLENLQTLECVKNFRCSEEIYKRMPNIRKLGVTFHDVNTITNYCLYNIGHFNKLESLKYFFHGNPNRDVLVENLKFPSSLKKLNLEGCKLFWEDLTMIGSLPHLEYLKLEYSVFGTEWNPNEGEFSRLRFLEILCCLDLTYWNAERSHFPVLEELVLVRLWKLEEIPLDLGEISTLRDIYVDECSVSAAVSAVKILEEQEGFGNEDLRVRVKLEAEKCEEFREKLEEEGLTTENFHLVDE